jgi:hypothetical protein
MRKKYTIKQILTTNASWWNFFEKHGSTLRPAIPKAIVKLLSCKHKVRGYHEYCCLTPGCSHVKYVCFTCKSKGCSSCGKKATEVWIQHQHDILPKTSWQHITFTMPSQLWDFFWLNRKLLKVIAKLAADCLKAIARKKKVTPGIFIAIHTFGRSLSRNVHIHVSTTAGGLSDDMTQWKNLFFKQDTVMKMWRYKIIDRFRKMHAKEPLKIPKAIQQLLTPHFTFNHFLNNLYKKQWIVNCGKPTNDHKINVDYLGSYTMRPPIAESKLRHYDGNEVTFSYLDHKTKTYKKLTLSSEEFIGRFVQHIPDEGFRMIRYYGFLANRVRGQLLTIVHQLIGQQNAYNNQALTYASLMEKSFGFNPLACILCGKQLVLSAVRFGISNVYQLLNFHRELALLKKIPA